MADVPELRSKEQIAGDLIDGILARLRKDIDLNRGSNLTQIIEAISQSNFRASAAVINMIDSQSIDRAVGEQLQRLARDRNVPVFPAESSSGSVNITDLTFQKVSSRIYSGQPAPVAGSLTIYISDGSQFKATNGQVYLGRGTANIEGPLDYVSVQPESGGAYWSITLSPTSPTTKFHNIGESVILAQGGDRKIQVGTTVITAQGASVNSVSFKTTALATIIDGEATVTGVPVRCASPGEIGNVPRGAIKQAIGVPFNVSVFNDNAFFNGTEADTEDDIRARIKAYELAKAKGTAAAIEYASNGVVAKDELKKVTSSKVINYSDTSSALIFDDGQGYEPVFVGAPFETVVDKATGGATELQLRQKPVVQARITNQNESPYNIVDNSFIAIEINGVETSHQFQSEDFRVPSSATAFELMASINGNPNINFSASTSNGGKNLVIYPRDRYANTIKIKPVTAGIDANGVLGFPTLESQTIRLYKNEKPLTQDGIEAKLSTRAKASWATSIISGDTLSYVVDETTPLTITFTTNDFQSVDPLTNMNSSTPIEVWAEVFNNKMPGIEALVVGDVITFKSSKGASSKASLRFTGGTLLPSIFDMSEALSAVGKTSDFTLNKQTGQIGLTVPLQPGDKITGGSRYARGNALSNLLANGVSAKGRIWLTVDSDITVVPNGMKTNSLISFSKTGTKLNISVTDTLSQPEGFESAQKHDWLIIYANSTDNPGLIANQGMWRIEDVSIGNIIVDDGTVVRSPASGFSPQTSRIVIVRSQSPMQEFDFTANSLSDFVAQAQTELVGVNTDIIGGRVRFSTATYDSSGSIFIAAADEGGQALGLPVGTFLDNTDSHFAFVSSTDAEVGPPTFSLGVLGPANTDSEFTEPDYQIIGGTSDDFLEVLSKYGAEEIPETNKNRRAFVSNFDETNDKLTVVPPAYMDSSTIPGGPGGFTPNANAFRTPLQEGDRYTLRSPYRFDSEDFAIAIIDGDTTVKTYTLPVSRKLKVSSHSTPTNQDFSADDAQSNLALKDPSSFHDFNFKDFKLHRQARSVLTDGNYSILVKSYAYGPNGNRIRVGLDYADSAFDTEIKHKISTSDVSDILIKIPAGDASTDYRVPNWDHDTSFTVTKTMPTPGMDELTFQWEVGTEPDFSVSGADVQIGDIAFIGATDFLPWNRNIKGKVTNVTPTSFTIQVPTGSYTTDTLSAVSILNQGGLVTVTTAFPHFAVSGQTLGLYGTAQSGLNKPLDGTYPITVVNGNTFTFNVSGLPGGAIQSATHINNVITATIVGHNLNVGDVVMVSGVGAGLYDGLGIVSEVSPNTIKFAKPGSSVPVFGIGRVDIQSYADSAAFTIDTVGKLGNSITVNTTSNHGLTSGAIVRIENVVINPWVNVTNYSLNDVVNYLGVDYVSLTNGNVGNQPDISPANWQVSVGQINGEYIVNTVLTPTSFQVSSPIVGNTGILAGGDLAVKTTAGLIARSIGGNTNENLQFAKVTTTAQEIVDYITTSLAGIATANLISDGLVEVSTSDLQAPNYIVTQVSGIVTYQSRRDIKFITDDLIPAGANIKVSGLATAGYDGDYVVIQSYVDAISGDNIAVVISDVNPAVSAVITDSGNVTGNLPAQMLLDGENSVLSNNLSSLVANPMFNLKRPFVHPLEVDEEVRLVAITTDHLVRFWNKLVVTGISNVAVVQKALYGRQLQISSQTFGAAGSVQISGGTANKLELALVGSGQELGNSQGVAFVPYEVKKGLTSGQWLNVKNNVRQNKDLGFSDTTSVRIWNDGVEIQSGGTFQTKRNTTQAADTTFKIEKHGQFLAFIRISGSSLGLATNGVVEGDWVRIKSDIVPNWLSSVTYGAGDRVIYDNVRYTSLGSGNIGNQPDISPLDWKVEQFNRANEGIFQVVRTYGEDAFWIDYENGIEEIATIGHADNLSFYSYDSVMPGDTLVINTTLFGPQNIGRYEVINETAIDFPQSNRIFTRPISNPGSGYVTLGGEYVKLNVEEKNPLSLWKKVSAVVPADNAQAAIFFDTPNLMNKINSSLASNITSMGKLGFNQNVNFGIDAYKYYTGLTKELNKIIYGDSTDPITYPGVRAAGTDVDIKEAVVRRITAALSVRVKSGVPFSEIRDRVKAAVAGYVNSLGVGESVSISRMVAAANAIPGVVSVAVTFPVYNAGNDLIVVSSFEKALVVDPTVDITVSNLT